MTLGQGQDTAGDSTRSRQAFASGRLRLRSRLRSSEDQILFISTVGGLTVDRKLFKKAVQQGRSER